jgi:mono/diheme cytochrome c family protein
MIAEDPVMWRTIKLSLLLAVLAGDGSAAAQTIGDAAAGRRLAEAWCAECHATGAKTVDGIKRAPDFAQVAKRPSTTALSLNVFLRSSHDDMPNFILTRGEADDIVAYILTLKER